LILKGEESIELTELYNFLLKILTISLTEEKDRVDDTTLKNHVEKILLHFLSLNYDPENLPYQTLPITELIKVL